MHLRCLLFALVLHTLPLEAETLERTASLASLFPEDEAASLSSVLALDEPVRWTLEIPENTDNPGVLVFVSATQSGKPQSGWSEVLNRRNLIWIAAEDFGNPQPSAKRVLAALMGLALVQKTYSVDSKRIYIGGMSGGGRIASRTITKFPRLFTGALYIVGVDFWTSDEKSQIDAIAANRYVFLTGHGDFNRRETKRIHKRYRRAGVQQTLLVDLPELGHAYPDAEQLDSALAFLDTGHSTN